MTTESWASEYGPVAGQMASVEALIARVACRGGACPTFHRQLLSRRSKRLRPALLLLAARFGRGDSPALVPAAAGLELLHQATLYHDDIVDEADVRRGRPTVQRRCGPVVASLAGTELLYATAELFAELPAPLRRAVGRTGDALCRGQLREIETLGRSDSWVRMRMRIMRDKTARLFALAARVGAELAGAAATVSDRLTRFGMRLGLVFQLADDLRDIVVPSDDFTRAPGSDVLHGVYTLPVLYALDGRGEASQALRVCLSDIRRAPQPGLVERALRYIEEAGGVERGRATLADWVALATSDLVLLAREAPSDVRGSMERILSIAVSGLGAALETGLRGGASAAIDGA